VGDHIERKTRDLEGAHPFAPPKGCQTMFEFVLNLVFDVIIDWFVFFRRKKKVPE
jgi:hypothetical protein